MPGVLVITPFSAFLSQHSGVETQSAKPLHLAKHAQPEDSCLKRTRLRGAAKVYQRPFEVLGPP